jgi:Tfp pilus assembly protein FimT
MLILAAIAIPALLGSIRNYEIRGAATEVSTEIQRARATAVMTNVRYGVVFVVRSNKEYQYVIEDIQDAETKAAATNLYVTPDTAVRAQLGPLRQLPGRVQFGTDCPGFGATNVGLRFNRLGTMCEPAGSESPRLPGKCPAIEGDLGDDRVQFAAGTGTATFCLRDSRGVARSVTVSPGGRVQIADVVLGS